MNIVKWIKRNSHISITQIIFGFILFFFAILNLTDTQLMFAGPNIKPDANPVTLLDDLPHIIGWFILLFAIDSFAFNLPFKALGEVLNPVIHLVMGRKAMANINRFLAKENINILDKLKGAGILYSDPESPTGYRISAEGSRDLNAHLEGEAERLINIGKKIREYRERD